MASRPEEDQPPPLHRRDLLRLLSATLPAAGVLGASSDPAAAGGDGGQDNGATTSCRLRGQMKTDSGGRYQFDSIRPGHHDGRPRHYHLIISSAGHVPLTTQIYFLSDPLLGPKGSCQPPTCNSGDPGRIVDFKTTTAGGKTSYQGLFDAVLQKM
jgi:protocatechuate 3,4-dioxygenase beta subunit